MVRISDSRMSGTSYGTCVLHVTPEAAVGGPLALVTNPYPRTIIPRRRCSDDSGMHSGERRRPDHAGRSEPQPAGAHLGRGDGGATRSMAAVRPSDSQPTGLSNPGAAKAVKAARSDGVAWSCRSLPHGTNHYGRGYGMMYSQHVTQADKVPPTPIHASNSQALSDRL